MIAALIVTLLACGTACGAAYIAYRCAVTAHQEHQHAAAMADRAAEAADRAEAIARPPARGEIVNALRPELVLDAAQAERLRERLGGLRAGEEV